MPLATAPRTPPAGCLLFFGVALSDADGAGNAAARRPGRRGAVDCTAWTVDWISTVPVVFDDVVTVAQFSPDAVRVTVRVSTIAWSSACLPFMCADFSLGLMTTNLRWPFFVAPV